MEKTGEERQPERRTGQARGVRRKGPEAPGALTRRIASREPANGMRRWLPLPSLGLQGSGCRGLVSGGESWSLIKTRGLIFGISLFESERNVVLVYKISLKTVWLGRIKTVSDACLVLQKWNNGYVWNGGKSLARWPYCLLAPASTNIGKWFIAQFPEYFSQLQSFYGIKAMASPCVHLLGPFKHLKNSAWIRRS